MLMVPSNNRQFEFFEHSVSSHVCLFRGKFLLDSMFNLHPEEEKKILDMPRARGLDHGDHTPLK
jgi:hypothetical protein